MLLSQTQQLFNVFGEVDSRFAGRFGNGIEIYFARVFVFFFSLALNLLNDGLCALNTFFGDDLFLACGLLFGSRGNLSCLACLAFAFFLGRLDRTNFLGGFGCLGFGSLGRTGFLGGFGRLGFASLDRTDFLGGFGCLGFASLGRIIFGGFGCLGFASLGRTGFLGGFAVALGLLALAGLAFLAALAALGLLALAGLAFLAALAALAELVFLAALAALARPAFLAATFFAGLAVGFFRRFRFSGSGCRFGLGSRFCCCLGLIRFFCLGCGCHIKINERSTKNVKIGFFGCQRNAGL